MNRFWKAVLCAVVLSSFVGCGSDDDDDGGGAGPVAGNNNNTSVVVVPKDFCAEYPTHSECQPKKEYVFKGIESQIGIENFEEEPDLKTWLFGTTGLYGAKYVIEKVATANQTYQFLNQLIVDKKFNKNYLDQWLNWIAWGGVQISNWLELIGLNTELRRYDIGFKLGDPGKFLIDTDLYIDRASVVVKEIDEDRFIVSLVTYVTGTFHEFDNASIEKIYGTLDAPVSVAKTERLYSPFVLTGTYNLKKYTNKLVETYGYSYTGDNKRQVRKYVNGTTYEFEYDHGADVLVWSAHKDPNYLEEK